MKMKTSDVIRKMRPYQKQLAPMIIQDVIDGSPPKSVNEAMLRYADLMGNPVCFDNGKGWSGDIRSAAIECLFKYGFVKSKAVALADDGSLSLWSTDRMTLEAAAALEIQFGGSKALSVKAQDIVKNIETIGEGPCAVYAYTDSRLDALGDHCVKIGRHHFSSDGSIINRIMSQYSTGNPGHPVIRVIAQVEDAVKLETQLHRMFKDTKVEGGFGNEWFAVSHTEVIKAMKEILRPNAHH